MPERIYKYLLKTSSTGLYANMPAGAQVVHAEITKPDEVNFTEHIHVWARVNPERNETARGFLVAATGDEIPSGATHILTWRDGPFIWHLFIR